MEKSENRDQTKLKKGFRVRVRVIITVVNGRGLVVNRDAWL